MSITWRSYRAAAMEILPKSFGENLNEWFRVLGRTWKPLLIASLVAFVPMSLALAGILMFTGAADVFADLMDPEYLESIPDTEILEEFVPLIWVGAIWILLQSIATLFVYLAASRTVAEDRAGLASTWRTAASHAGRRLVPALLAGAIAFIGLVVLIALAVAVGWILIELMGTEFLAIFVTSVAALTTLVILVWLALALSLYPQVMTMEEAGPTEALRRSFVLVRQRWWVTFGFVLVASVIASAVSQVVGFVFAPLSILAMFNPQALAVVYVLVGLIQGPVAAAIAAANAVWYLDLRSRNEPLASDQIV
ncbi:MAG TPA: hypothetical protein VFS66_00730 [Acidimicrobiia bacterium]|nr:hypothetical protein [Acidimicrobiia bacterium]